MLLQLSVVETNGFRSAGLWLREHHVVDDDRAAYVCVFLLRRQCEVSVIDLGLLFLSRLPGWPLSYQAAAERKIFASCAETSLFFLILYSVTSGGNHPHYIATTMHTHTHDLCTLGKKKEMTQDWRQYMQRNTRFRHS